MHKYTDGIGFSNYDSEESMYAFFRKTYDEPDEVNHYSHDVMEQYEEEFVPDEEWGQQEDHLVEYRKDFSDSPIIHYGLVIGGAIVNWNAETIFYRKYYFPYLEGRHLSVTTFLGTKSDLEVYEPMGIAEDERLGPPFFFQMINPMEIWKKAGCCEGEVFSELFEGVRLSGIASYARVLLPTQKRNNENRPLEGFYSASTGKGDLLSLEKQTRAELKTYVTCRRRSMSEDIYSIVEDYFIPFGYVPTQYSLMGEIVQIDTSYNDEGMEQVYVIALNINGVLLDVCATALQIEGELEVGRRLKCDVLLQGRVIFKEGFLES